MTSKFIIYALHHDDSDHVYIGQSSRGMLRPKEHGYRYQAYSECKLPIQKWVKKRKESGQEYNISILEECSSRKDLDEAERFHIEYLKSLGIPLLNCTTGGHRPIFADKSRRHTEETKAKISASKTGKSIPALRRKFSDAHKTKLSLAKIGKKRSFEVRADFISIHKYRKADKELTFMENNT